MSTFDEGKAGHTEHYYTERGCVIDCRGSLKISPLSYWGWFVHVYTTSHDISTGEFNGPAISRPVEVGDYAWICSDVVLYNCKIEHHGIVSVGSVVKGLVVPPYHIAEGNPAILVAKWNGEKWLKIKK